MYDEQGSSLLHEVGSLRISALRPTVTTSYCHKHRTTIVYISVCSDESEHVDHLNSDSSMMATTYITANPQTLGVPH